MASFLMVLAVCGCREGGAPGASSPKAAVERFLAPFAKSPSGTAGSTASKEITEFWASTCDQVDPQIRPGLRFYERGAADPRVNCGAMVTLLVLYTGDTGTMMPPSTVSGNPVSVDTADDLSVVSVDMRYGSDAARGASPLPPAEATINVLVVRRDGAWWVATPQAFNPLHAADGGFSEAELRDQHKKLLEAK